MSLVAGHATLRIPVLEQDGLRLRAPEARDFEAYAAFCASPRSAGVGGPFVRAEAENRFMALTGHWMLHGYGRWLVADRESDAPLGVVGLMFPADWPEPEIAWTVFAGAEGRGVAHAAARIARRFAYEDLGWRTAISCTAPENRRSAALARRLGAVRDGVFAHPRFGSLLIWRHPSPAVVARAEAAAGAPA